MSSIMELETVKRLCFKRKNYYYIRKMPAQSYEKNIRLMCWMTFVTYSKLALKTRVRDSSVIWRRSDVFIAAFEYKKLSGSVFLILNSRVYLTEVYSILATVDSALIIFSNLISYILFVMSLQQHCLIMSVFTEDLGNVKESEWKALS